MKLHGGIILFYICNDVTPIQVRGLIHHFLHNETPFLSEEYDRFFFQFV